MKPVPRVQFTRSWKEQQFTEMMSWTLWSTLGHQRWVHRKCFNAYLILRQHYYIFRAVRIQLTNVLGALLTQGGDVISTILRREFTYDQRQGTCAEVRGQLSQQQCSYINILKSVLPWLSICFISLQYFNVANANCTKDSDCVQGEVDFDGHGTVFIPHKIVFQAWLSIFHSEFVSKSIFNTFLQAGGQANVFNITTTPSKPVRSKAGVLLRNMLQYGKHRSVIPNL